MTPTITVYSKPNCQQCTATKSYLNSRGLPFVEADILEPENLALVQSLGHQQAPVVIDGEHSWAGFRPDKIDAAVERRRLAE